MLNEFDKVLGLVNFNFFKLDLRLAVPVRHLELFDQVAVLLVLIAKISDDILRVEVGLQKCVIFLIHSF